MPVTFNQASPSSNKSTQISLQKIAYRAPSEKVTVLKPHIDKLSVIYDLWHLPGAPETKHELHTHINQGLWDLVTEDPSFTQESIFTPSRYKTNVWWSAASGAKVFIQAHPKKAGTRFFRFEFNPALISPSEMKDFDKHWFALSVGHSCLNDIYGFGRASRIDVAVDMVGIGLSDLIVTGTDKSRVWFSDQGAVETVYTGVKLKKASGATAYNKRAQLASKELTQIYNGVAHTRVEFHHRTRLAVKDLAKLKSKLGTVSVSCPKRYKPADSAPDAWEWFLDSVRHRGRDKAIGLAASESQKLILSAALDEASQGLWRPKDIWKFWPEAVSHAGLNVP